MMFWDGGEVVRQIMDIYIYARILASIYVHINACIYTYIYIEHISYAKYGVKFRGFLFGLISVPD